MIQYKAITKYKLHPSIIKIKETRNNSTCFDFNYISAEEIMFQITNLNSSKSNPINSIPGKMVKQYPEFFSNILYNNLNNSIYSSSFPNNLKLADITPTHKNGERQEKENYRPVSILPSISKIYEKVLYKQLYTFF